MKIKNSFLNLSSIQDLDRLEVFCFLCPAPNSFTKCKPEPTQATVNELIKSAVIQDSSS